MRRSHRCGRRRFFRRFIDRHRFFAASTDPNQGQGGEHRKTGAGVGGRSDFRHGQRPVQQPNGIGRDCKDCRGGCHRGECTPRQWAAPEHPMARTCGPPHRNDSSAMSGASGHTHARYLPRAEKIAELNPPESRIQKACPPVGPAPGQEPVPGGDPSTRQKACPPVDPDRARNQSRRETFPPTKSLSPSRPRSSPVLRSVQGRHDSGGAGLGCRVLRNRGKAEDSPGVAKNGSLSARGEKEPPPACEGGSLAGGEGRRAVGGSTGWGAG
jgi:hypothetical protein